MASFPVLFAFSAILAGAETHPTYYEIDERYLLTDELPPFRSYHIHMMFVNRDNDSTNAAMALRQEFIEQFNLTNTAPCTGLFHQGRLCMYEVRFDPDEYSPFISGQWAVFVPIEYYPICVPWIMQHRNGMDIIVHPNSGKATNDHLLWSLWGGTPWPINVAPFTT